MKKAMVVAPMKVKKLAMKGKFAMKVASKKSHDESDDESDSKDCLHK